jgi:hypothetical protein
LLDFLLGLGSSFDWVSPIFFFLKDLIKGPVADFGIDAYSGWNVYNLKQLFLYYEISVWGLTYSLKGDILMFTVSKVDAQRTYSLLIAAGIPMVYIPDEIDG